MSVEKIPQSFRYICDVCGMAHLQENAGGHYTDSRPPHWARLTIAQAAHDYQGMECADATIARLLCDDCRAGAVDAINVWAESRKRQ
jgi:hypothetical protein